MGYKTERKKNDSEIFFRYMPKKIIKLRSSKSRNSFKNKHFYFKYKKFNLSLNIYDDTCENNSVTLRFINGEKIVIKPLEKLLHYDKLIIKTINDKRFYIPHVKKEIIEKITSGGLPELLGSPGPPLGPPWAAPGARPWPGGLLGRKVDRF